MCPGHHGIRQLEQRGGEEPSGVRALRAEAQHPAAAEGLHRAAVHVQARAPHGFPPGLLREAREGARFYSPQVTV